MSLSIFYIVIASITIIYSGMCFRCYVCNSNSDKYCDDKPRIIAQCSHSAVGCVKLTTNMVEYKFINSTGGEVTEVEWDGVDTNWEPVLYTRKVTIRRCGNNYARYQPEARCRSIPFVPDNDFRELICYCKAELCNKTTRNETNKFLCCAIFILIQLYASYI